MANLKTSALTTLTGANTATGDKLLFLDVSDTSGGAGGTLKAITRAELKEAMAAEISGSSFAALSDTQTSGTNGGTFTSGSWQTRVLNTEEYDPDGIVSISSNQFTLAAGTYRIRSSAVCYDVDAHMARIQNITDTTTDLLGLSCHAQDSGPAGTEAMLEGFITIAGAKAFELQHRCATTKTTYGFGAAQSFGDEIYSRIVIEKLA